MKNNFLQISGWIINANSSFLQRISIKCVQCYKMCFPFLHTWMTTYFYHEKIWYIFSQNLLPFFTKIKCDSYIYFLCWHEDQHLQGCVAVKAVMTRLLYYVGVGCHLLDYSQGPLYMCMYIYIYRLMGVYFKGLSLPKYVPHLPDFKQSMWTDIQTCPSFPCSFFSYIIRHHCTLLFYSTLCSIP